MSQNDILSTCQTRQRRNLLITEEQFDELYPDLKGYYSFFNSPPPTGLTPEEFERRYLSNKLWRLNNIYTIIGKDGSPCVFRMNYGQHKVYAASRQHSRVIILKSRQQGISTLWLVSYFDDAVFAPFLNLGLMAQGTDEAATLLERAKFLWDTLADDVKQFIGVRLEKDNTKEFAFSNNSTIFIRVSFRSTTLQRLHVSEFGKIANQYPKRAKETKTGTLQALAPGNTGIIESTAEGRNMFKQMWDDAVICEQTGRMAPKDFKPVFLSWLDDPDCNSEIDQLEDKEAQKYFDELEEKTGRKLTKSQRNFWVIQRRELGGDIFQEYPATPEEAFTAARDGTYWSKLFTQHVIQGGRILRDLYDPNLPVEAYFDLGVDDYAVVGIVQWYRGRWRLVDEFWGDGMALTWWIDQVAAKYPIRQWNLPHDAAVRESGSRDASGRAKSREDIARDHIRDEQISGYVSVLPRTSIADGIEAVRRMIPLMEIDEKCVYLKDCALNYSKEWDDKLQVWKQIPVHDEYSHGADVLRYIGANTVELQSRHESELSNQHRARSSSGYAV